MRPFIPQVQMQKHKPRCQLEKYKYKYLDTHANLVLETKSLLLNDCNEEKQLNLRSITYPKS